MTVQVELEAGEMVIVPDSIARKIMEVTMSLCEEMYNMEDDELRPQLGEIRDLLDGYNLLKRK